MTDLLQMPNKLSCKKRKQINNSIEVASLAEISSRKAIISSLNSRNNKELFVSIAITIKWKHKAKNIDIVIIGTDDYCATCLLKETQVFVVSLRNILYQAK